MAKRNYMIRVRFNEIELEQLKKLSDESGLSMSSLIRENLSKTKIKNRSDEKAQISTLNRINANLNMIARWVNTYKSKGETVEVVAHLISVNRAINELKE